MEFGNVFVHIDDWCSVSVVLSQGMVYMDIVIFGLRYLKFCSESTLCLLQMIGRCC